MIDFIEHAMKLVMRYTPENVEPDWLARALSRDNQDPIPFSRRAFVLRPEIYRPDLDDGYFVMDACYRFEVGCLRDDYYHMDRDFLGIEYDLFMHRELAFKRSTFVAERNIPIFRGFNNYGFTELWVGGARPGALPQPVFEEMLAQFPNSYELDRYAKARVSSMIRNYVPFEQDFEAQYTRYREKKASAKGSQPRREFNEYESDKFSSLVDKMDRMLRDAIIYSEKQWQAEILQVIRFIYPKYIRAFPECPVRDSLAGKSRSIDFLLVDASGHVDGVEIKKPFAECVVTSNRYRDNHVPMRELTGTVMQMEKYLFHLNRWGDAGERKLNDRYADELPDGVRIRILNPSGMIIMGRDNALTADQKSDFEIIRRKYRNVVEVMTYDDVVRRLKAIRDQFQDP
jgi:hypothetical protein